MPNNIPNILQQAVGAVVRKRYNAVYYAININGVGAAQTAIYSGHRDLEPGERVRATWRHELRKWEISALGSTTALEFLYVCYEDTSESASFYPLEVWSVTKTEATKIQTVLTDQDNAPQPIMDLSPNGKHLAVAFSNDVVVMYGIDDDGLITGVEDTVTVTGVNAVRWHPSGQYLTAWGPNLYTILMSNVTFDTPVLGLTNVFSAAWSPNGADLAVGRPAPANHLTVYPFASGSFGTAYSGPTWPGSSGSGGSPAWHPTGKFLAFVEDGALTGDSNISVWPWDNGFGTRLPDPDNWDDTNQIYILEWSPNGQRITAPDGAGDPTRLLHYPFNISTIGDVQFQTVVGPADAVNRATESVRYSRSGQFLSVAHDEPVDERLTILAANGSAIAQIYTSFMRNAPHCWGGGIIAPMTRISTSDIDLPGSGTGTGGSGTGTDSGSGGGGTLEEEVGPGPVLPPSTPPPSDPLEPWTRFFPTPIGYCTENPTCDEEYLVTGSSAGDITNLRAAAAEGGVAIQVQEGLTLNFGSTPLEFEEHTALIGLGTGFKYTGSGLYIIDKGHILIRNCEMTGTVAQDGIRLNYDGADQIRIDQWKGGYCEDEMMDFWYGVGRVTISRCLYPNSEIRTDFGLLVALPPEDQNDPVNTRITLYESVGYTEGRWPLFGPGRFHMVNCVKPRWGYEAMQIRYGGTILAERNWFGPNAGRDFLTQGEGGGSFKSVNNVWDGIEPQPNVGTGTFTPPYSLGTSMTTPRRDQILALAGRGTILMSASRFEYLIEDTLGLDDTLNYVES